MSHITQSAVHCINPDCQRPYPQPWGNKFCNSCGAPLQLLDRYLPIEPLGSGGFAQIYTIWDEKTQTEKVLKVLVETSPKALELFTQEAAVLIGLRNTGVPRVEAEGYFQINLPQPKPHQLACLVMEKINGQNLEEIRRSYPQGCPEDLVLNWFLQAVKILQELHKSQIIHRDIKPSNLMLRNSGGTSTNQLVLIDFGGAKQFSGAILRYPSSSTRLYSSGYSPPEQVTGGNVGPAADFYALGRTMIELLTGKYPPELEDPVTGQLRWRNQGNFNPRLADLIDEMVQEDVRSRPANAAIIQKRLVKISQAASKQGLFAPVKNAFKQISQQFNLLIQAIEQALDDLNQGIADTSLFIIKAIAKLLLACLATVWSMVLAGIGAAIGAIAGFLLAYRTNLGDRLVEFMLYQVPELLPNTQPVVGAEIIVFAVAGLGTAWGLTLSGSFGQKRRFLVASLMGMISYGLGWIIYQLITPQNSGEGLTGWILVAISLLTLSLGIRSHHLVYAFIAAFGSASFFAVLIFFGFPAALFQFSSQPTWLELAVPIAFFSFVGVLISFWLGVSHYLIVPGLRWLGWR
ncbi:serine/threonine protein kinase [Cylindrospermum stagnale PCC 7417]|uniref:non-specific serine/threonine protein kinase n=1 Tax=Cylindrospermum stagnale PCC 7417 TaxID=56107 RepID=K9WQ15_9NOST|nr:serine/threonine-protein kinase [Cylindrospermum stagnale]AFZ22480.1 serine/threonine protein kinase [Cylindrospermum stagnale PCC 7417]